MGWAAGTELAEKVWQVVRPYIPEAERESIAFKVYDLFCDEDADAWDSRCQLIIDALIPDEDEIDDLLDEE